MAIYASDIKDEASFKAWLNNQSEDVAQVIASRSALRKFPIALSIHQENHPKLTAVIKFDLTLQVFLANFISWFACKYPTHDFSMIAASSASASAASAASASASAAAIAAVFAAVDAIAIAADAAIAAVRTADAAAIVRGDAEWLENNPDDIEELINQPLWLEPSVVPEAYRKLQNTINDKFDTFSQSDLARETSFGLIADWYAALLPERGKPRSLFGEKKDLELATQPEEFWKGEAQEVMDRVADLVGWPDDYRNLNYLYEDSRNEGEALNFNEDKKDYQDGRTKSEIFPKTDAKKISANRTIFRFQLTAIVNSSAIELKNFGDQPNEKEAQEDWLKKKKFLENIHKLAIDALELLPIEPDGTRNEKDDEVASLLSQYAQGFDKGLRKNEPEVVDWVIRLGSAAGFIGLVSMAGGFMPFATPVILGITCGDKAVNILRDLRSSQSKKKPKDKDG